MNYVPLLHLLEHPLPEAKSLIASGALPMGAYESAAESFPYSGLVAYAVNLEGSGYWNEKAVNWLEQGVPIDEQVVRAVEAMAESKRASQRTRHRALRLVREWEGREAS